MKIYLSTWTKGYEHVYLYCNEKLHKGKLNHENWLISFYSTQTTEEARAFLNLISYEKVESYKKLIKFEKKLKGKKDDGKN